MPGETYLFQGEPSLPVLPFNFEGLKAWAMGMVEKYTGLVVTDDAGAIAAAKNDMAEINKAKARVEHARKEAVKRISEPIREFEAQVKEVCSIFDEAYTSLAAQVKAYEEQERRKKCTTVKGIIAELRAEHACPEDELSIPILEKWLNKTTSLKSIKADVLGIITAHREEQQRKAVLEQARRDRLAAIEAHVKALNTQAGVDVPLAQFLASEFTGESRPLEEVLPLVGQRHAEVVAAQRPAGYSPAEDEEEVAAEQARLDGLTTSTPRRGAGILAMAERAKASTKVTLSIVIEVDGERLTDVYSLLADLKGMCVKYAQRTV